MVFQKTSTAVIRAVRGAGMVIAVAILPSVAFGHAGGPAFAGLAEGFNHPMRGWDHLLVMMLVGVWAAQQRGRIAFEIPATFLAVMTLGALIGTVGVFNFGAEAMIVISIIVFAALAATRAQVGAFVALGVVALFAFFHGFVHGQEISGAASVSSFVLGFLISTSILHGMGYAIARAAMAFVALSVNGKAFAGETVASGPRERSVRMEEIIVRGRQDNLIGFASSAAQGTVGAAQLAQRPTLRAGEVLETVPGVILTQHAGGGKANQYFARGFNLDHGTDFATSLDGMPINLRSHGHGQGYSDMNIVIPELVERVNYEKGVYDPANGDFSSVGAGHIETFKTLPRSFGVLEGGMYGYGRAVGATSASVGAGVVLIGAELAHSDGPWVRGDDFWKKNGLLTYAQGSDRHDFSVTLRGYHGQWASSDQVAQSAVETGVVPLYGALDDTTGGTSQRYSVQGEWRRAGDGSRTNVMAYGFYYDLDLLSNFTYFLTDVTNGDQFEQVDKRWTTGARAMHVVYGKLLDRPMENTLGLELRRDDINNGLFNTRAGVRMAKVNDNDGNVIPATARQDKITESSGGVYVHNKVQWTDWLRTEAGLRGDLYGFTVANARAENSGTRSDAIVSPKLGIIFGPWANTELYLQAGRGFHSNDARGVLTRVDPITGAGADADGNAITPADPLVRTTGGEVGLRTSPLPGLQSTVSVWRLDVDSELLFVGDAGTTEASRPSRRYGIEFANFYTPVPWLTLDADLSLSHARYRDGDVAGNDIPGSIETAVSAGVTLQDTSGLFGSLRLRYFGPRPLIEDNSVRSGDTVLFNARLGYALSDRLSIAAEVFNLLNGRDHDIDYFYESRVTPTAVPREEVHFHPVEPRQLRISLRYRL